MNYVKSKKGGRLFSLFMVLAMVLTSVPAALLASADEVYADTITVKLNVDDKEYIYGGSGVSHYFTATVNGKRGRRTACSPIWLLRIPETEKQPR